MVMTGKEKKNKLQSQKYLPAFLEESPELKRWRHALRHKLEKQEHITALWVHSSGSRTFPNAALKWLDSYLSTGPTFLSWSKTAAWTAFSVGKSQKNRAATIPHWEHLHCTAELSVIREVSLLPSFSMQNHPESRSTYPLSKGPLLIAHSNEATPQGHRSGQKRGAHRLLRVSRQGMEEINEAGTDWIDASSQEILNEVLVWNW